MKNHSNLIIYGFAFLLLASCQSTVESNDQKKPNFLFCIADDWSYPHAGVYGDKVAQTPHFDRLANEGILFTNAYTAAPSCSPSRAAILTGQDFYRLEAGGNLFGTMPKKYPIYTTLLENAGYAVGYTGKGYAPADLSLEGWDHNPAGVAYQEEKMKVQEGIRNTDYASNFKKFISTRKPDQPFSFWYGSSEPHRRYDYGIGARNGYDLSQIDVPKFLPDTEETRNDVADYYYEVEWSDYHLGEIIDHLEEIGELDNTVIIVTSDNGMPFPKAKSNLYTYGVQMPFTIRYGNVSKTKRIVDEPISHTDIAPTILNLAGLDIPATMTGRSLKNIIHGEEDLLDRDFVIVGMERHTESRPNRVGYPMRAIFTKEYSYIHNFESDRWPAGNPDFDAWPQGAYGDVDGGATKSLFLDNPDKWPKLFKMALQKRPQEELYAVKSDPFNMHNLADHPQHADLKSDLKARLFSYLKDTDDPRVNGQSPWDNYYYSGGK